MQEKTPEGESAREKRQGKRHDQKGEQQKSIVRKESQSIANKRAGQDFKEMQD